MTLVDYASPFASSAALLLLVLCAGHAVADFGLQSEYMAVNKAPRLKDERTGALVRNPHWAPIMLAHCLIHAGMVAVITGSAALGLAELAVHVALDVAKCEGRTSYGTDQTAHYLCKAAWTAVMLVATN